LLASPRILFDHSPIRTGARLARIHIYTWPLAPSRPRIFLPAFPCLHAILLARLLVCPLSSPAHLASSRWSSRVLAHPACSPFFRLASLHLRPCHPASSSVGLLALSPARLYTLGSSPARLSLPVRPSLLTHVPIIVRPWSPSCSLARPRGCSLTHSCSPAPSFAFLLASRPTVVCIMVVASC